MIRRFLLESAGYGVALAVVAIPQFAQAQLSNPVGCNNLVECIEKVIQYVLLLAGVLALAGIVYGGFLYILSVGDERKIGTAKNAITYSVIGIIIIGFSYAILKFIFGALGGGGAPPGGRPPGGVIGG